MGKLHGSRRVVQSKDFEMTTETSKSSVTGRWMHNGTEVKSSQRTTITQRGAQHSLKVSGAKLSDAGEYTFKVGSKQTTAEVVVEEVKVTRVFTEMKVKETHATEFQVELSVEDAGVCTWMKDDQIVTPTSNIRIWKEGKVRKLEIKSCGDSDAGLYKCQVLDGVDGCAAQLCVSPVRFTSELPKSVKCDESTREVDIACEIDDDDVTITWKKVEITKKLHGSRRVVQSKDFEMTTETSKSSVTGRWMHNGTEVKSSQRTTITQRGAQHSLKVSGAKLSDAGEYTFKVGSKQTTAEVV